MRQTKGLREDSHWSTKEEEVWKQDITIFKEASSGQRQRYIVIATVPNSCLCLSK